MKEEKNPDRRKRYTYSASNAFRFKPAFDIFLSDPSRRGKDLIIDCPHGRSIKGFHISASDALLWLAENHDEEHLTEDGLTHEKDSYKRLKERGKIMNLGDCLKITYQGRTWSKGSAYSVRSVERSDDPDAETWKDKILKYIQNLEPWLGKVFELKDLDLSEDEMDTAKRILDQVPGCVHNISRERIVSTIVPSSQPETNNKE